MLAKPFLFTLILILSIVNFIFVLTPVLFVILPIIFFSSFPIQHHMGSLAWMLIASVSGLMCLYVTLDFIFSFTVRRITRHTVPHSQMTAISGIKEIGESFEWLKRKFEAPKVELYIDPSIQDVNAYAVAGMRRQVVVLTMGLIQRIHGHTQNQNQFLDAIRGVLAHEMSHLVNQDFLPGLIIAANQTAVRQVSGFFHKILFLMVGIMRFVPLLGGIGRMLLITVYRIIHFLVSFFLRLFVMPIYNFFRKWFGRSIEYRCDRDAAYAFGGARIASALSMLGKGSYISIFSTHPRTKARIKKVEHLAARPGTIRAGFFSKVSGTIALVALFFMCAVSISSIDRVALEELYQAVVHSAKAP